MTVWRRELLMISFHRFADWLKMTINKLDFPKPDPYCLTAVALSPGSGALMLEVQRHSHPTGKWLHT